MKSKLVYGAFFVLTLFGCSQASHFAPLPAKTNPVATTGSVCNPFATPGSGSSSGSDPQIWAKMVYLPAASINLDMSSPSYGYITDGTAISTFNDLATHGLDYPANFYFSDINVPEQTFNAGFTITNLDNTKSLVTYPSTSTSIVSYFGLTFETDLLLPSGADQAYQFALLSDDGSSLYLNSSQTPGPGTNPSSLVVSNDGVHSVASACSTSPFTLSSATKTHMRLDWFQGPPYYLGVTLYYRPWTNSTCNLSDSSWQVVPASWYQLPDTVPLSNCN